VIVAIQYYEGDRTRAIHLARLLADLEPKPRNDILLAFVRKPDTLPSKEINSSLSYCSQKFPVKEVVTDDRWRAQGWPKACGELWAGTVEYFNHLFEEKQTQHHSMFVCDGGDGVPLHLNWIDLMAREHEHTIAMKRLITGTPFAVGTPLLINPNTILHLSLWTKYPSLCHVPDYDGTVDTCYDAYHRFTFLKECSASSIIHTDWQGRSQKICLDIMQERSQRSVWLHGYHDEELYDVAREHLAKKQDPPTLFRYNLNMFVPEP
jgi:hypothetical protein